MKGSVTESVFADQQGVELVEPVQNNVVALK